MTAVSIWLRKSEGSIELLPLVDDAVPLADVPLPVCPVVAAACWAFSKYHSELLLPVLLMLDIFHFLAESFAYCFPFSGRRLPHTAYRLPHILYRHSAGQFNSPSRISLCRMLIRRRAGCCQIVRWAMLTPG